MNSDELVVFLYDPPPPYGGVRVSSTKMLYSLKTYPGVHYLPTFFESSPRSILISLLLYANALCRSEAVLFQIGDVRALMRKRGVLYLLASTVLRRPIIYRGFAGGLLHQVESMPVRKQKLLRWMLSKCHLVTFETQTDLREFRAFLGSKSPRIEWLPNTRAVQSFELAPKDQARRFCFIGKVGRPKGVHRIVEAASHLPADVTIDIYGPMEPHEAVETGLDWLGDNSQVRYCGVLAPENVPQVLQNYDGLLLPTTWKTEGHPGVILEAFSVGVPVIATRWNGIPELVDHSCGILIEPDSTEALIEAIDTMHADRETWQAMRHGALARLKAFDSEVWSRKLHQWIMETVQ